MNTELISKYQTEVERLNGEIAHYDQQWTKVPRFAWSALMCPIAGFAAGWGAAFVALLVAAALVGVRAYLIAVRKGENVWMRDRLLSDMSAAGRVDPPRGLTQHPA